MRLQRPLLSGYPAQALAHKEIALAYYRPIEALALALVLKPSKNAMKPLILSFQMKGDDISEC